MPRSVNESPEVLRAVAEQTGVELDEVVSLVGACRDAVDELIADDYSVLAPPLIYATASDPVYLALANRLETCTDAEGQECLSWDDARLAAWLGLDSTDLTRHPVADESELLHRLLQRLGLDLPSTPDNWPEEAQVQAQRALVVLRAWVDTFPRQRRYQVGPAGLEKDFENWLLDNNLDRLTDLGYPVELEHRQLRMPGTQWRIPDLICRFTADTGSASAGDWLVIENKATPAYLEAGDQLASYVTQVEADLARRGQRVFGLLIADGASARVQAHLDQLGLGYASLTSLGYRRRTWPEPAQVPDQILNKIRR